MKSFDQSILQKNYFESDLDVLKYFKNESICID